MSATPASTPALLNPSYPAVELAPLLREASPRVILYAPPARDKLTGLARDKWGRAPGRLHRAPRGRNGR